MAPRFSGVLVPASTPFHSDLSPDPARFIKLCRWLLAEGADGLAVFGTTSEANSIGLKDRRVLTETLVKDGVPAAKLLPGTGTCALSDTVDMTRHALDLGCGGVLVLPPFYYKNPNEEGLFASFSELIQRLGDTRLQLYLYHFPQMAGVGIPVSVIERLVKAYPDTIAGLKDSSGDWTHTATLIKAFPSMNIFPSSEARVVEALKLGGAGCISASANIQVRAIRRLIDIWDTEEGVVLNEKVTRLRQSVEKHHAVCAIKAILAEFSGDEAWNIVAPPLTPLASEARQIVCQELRDQGFTLSFDAA